MGQAVTQGLLQSNTASSRIAWSVLPAAGLSGPDQVAEMIINESAWVAVVSESVFIALTVQGIDDAVQSTLDPRPDLQLQSHLQMPHSLQATLL